MFIKEDYEEFDKHRIRSDLENNRVIMDCANEEKDQLFRKTIQSKLDNAKKNEISSIINDHYNGLSILMMACFKGWTDIV